MNKTSLYYLAIASVVITQFVASVISRSLTVQQLAVVGEQQHELALLSARESLLISQHEYATSLQAADNQNVLASYTQLRQPVVLATSGVASIR